MDAITMLNIEYPYEMIKTGSTKIKRKFNEYGISKIECLLEDNFNLKYTKIGIHEKITIGSEIESKHNKVYVNKCSLSSEMEVKKNE